MKLAVNKWNVKAVNEKKPISYYGYKTRKEAQAFCDSWNSKHELKIEVIRLR